MTAHDALDDGEAQAGTGGVAACFVKAGEGQLEAFDFLDGYAGAAVGDLDADAAGFLPQVEADGRIRRLAQGVVDQVAGGPAQRLGADIG